MVDLFEIGKVYNGRVYDWDAHNGELVYFGLYLCTNITQKSKNGYAGDRYGSFRRVYPKKIEDYNERTYVSKLYVDYGLTHIDWLATEECYTKSSESGPNVRLHASDEYTGNWYPKSNKKTKKKDIPIMKRELEL